MRLAFILDGNGAWLGSNGARLGPDGFGLGSAHQVSSSGFALYYKGGLAGLRSARNVMLVPWSSPSMPYIVLESPSGPTLPGPY